MEQHTVTIAGTASYSALNAEQHSSTEMESNYEISEFVGDFNNLYSSVLPGKQYRVVAGRLYVIDPGSPPNLHP